MNDDINYKISQFGWTVVSVGAEGGEYPFAYSIGLQQEFGCSEILAFATTTDSAAELVYLCVDYLKSENTGLNVNEPIFGIINKPLSCMFFEIKKENFREYLGHAIRYYGHERFDVMQCVWPDKNGSFPWDNNVQKLVKSVQKRLF